MPSGWNLAKTWPAYPKRSTISKCYLAVKHQRITLHDLHVKNKYVHALVFGRMKSELAAKNLKLANRRRQRAVEVLKRKVISLVEQKRRMQSKICRLATQKSVMQSKIRRLAKQKSYLNSTIVEVGTTMQSKVARLQKLVSDQNKMLGEPNKRCKLPRSRPKSAYKPHPNKWRQTGPMKRTLARIMASVKKGSTSILELHDISAPLAEWIADHVNDSGYREMQRYLADDTDQMLANLGCDLNDLEIPM